ncbi:MULTISPECIES: UDP-N-acetylmuramoylalanyl-D-glutamyl-2,6-diaminopimelate--D-alanyl-D-alanine ligase [Methylobacterium]|uniref:UDP-N-acetylmuramoyl-tripeptide--D-alanyl-D-alanine ligase n=1 Tax=Methylobacterium oryzae CBMB20 TaxID=693986 RepID=A0A089Q7J8_9HYPH|nr:MULTISPECIES: UDP-N-acetylmuramoylalanyl-D-glutamyl-2,6-diaminopimelate--D-alanyl-D-alanine ligase [Methylobacterium]AIQ90544.1 UDP-N-acetylmuramoyl-tripeptide-D-alanyl-D-alanine ligase [Methylobacterium oryzae CBMB20]AWV17320.1 UDP-N-acetylmuramoylalanyl-D-glutamyl-2, 6-diaminopimelate--D-alanyl-D-alanine ligase [Methylobacterium sp. XJLW]WFS10260.1 UDP-N-acetylmuramoylalanyl-D-glutamyl-2,6-diaminopimelate--D-alanyl-D-alanine ligase [Methylobacterium sp. 391_Methyba4]
MTALWTREELESATGGRLIGPARAIGGASIDTRTLQPGDLFFAIRGDARDGHDFVPDALGRGAGAAVVSASRLGDLASHGPVLAVPEAGADPVLTAMVRLGAAARARTGAQVVAVTGSVGKTGTKEALRHVLAEQGETHASAASYNNHWGVPLTLARMPRSTRYGVFEIGMNHGGEIVPLTAQVRPDIALITTIAPAHIEHFASLAAIADAKGEIFSGLQPGGVAIVNRDVPHFDRLAAHAQASRAGRVVTFGEHPDSDVRALKIVLRPDLSVIDAAVMGQPVTYKLGTAGRHAALNSLGVMAVVHSLGADLARAALSLGSLTPPAGRGERTALEIGGGTAYLVDESYNANPVAVRAALATLAGIETGPRGRRIAVLGDMLELGAAAPDLHRGLAEAIEAARIDLVFTAGPLMRHLFEALPVSRRGAVTDTAADLLEPLARNLRSGDVVMVKGSNGSRMGRIVEALKARYAVDPTRRTQAVP